MPPWIESFLVKETISMSTRQQSLVSLVSSVETVSLSVSPINSDSLPTVKSCYQNWTNTSGVYLNCLTIILKCKKNSYFTIMLTMFIWEVLSIPRSPSHSYRLVTGVLCPIEGIICTNLPNIRTIYTRWTKMRGLDSIMSIFVLSFSSHHTPIDTNI